MMHLTLRPVYITILLCLAGSFSSCRHNSRPDISEIEGCDSIPRSIKQLVKAVTDNDSVSFASLVSYPLERPYPLRNIESPEEMTRYYSTIVDDSLRHIITSSRPDDWMEFGWRGWSLKREGLVWVDDDLYAIDYLSAREKVMLDSLTAREMASLGQDLAKGWKPEMCLKAISDSAVYRIDSGNDSNGTPRYRLLIYPAGSDLKAMPAYTMVGYRDTEGTAGTRIYYFTDTEGRAVRFSPDSPDGSTPWIEFPDSISDVTPAYWLDLVK